MWDEYGLGVQPQSLHFTITYRVGVAQISDKIPKARSAWATITWWVHINMHILQLRINAMVERERLKDNGTGDELIEMQVMRWPI